jgi:hypothetical protein
MSDQQTIYSNHRDPDAHIVDRIARARHDQALAALSTRTRAQLHNRLRAALAGQPAHGQRMRMPAWSWAATAALVLAFAFGAPWRNLHEPAATTATALAAATPAATVAPTADSALATLDQNPDFYLWLASSDAVALASE